MTENSISVIINFSSGKSLEIRYTHERWEKLKKDIKMNRKIFIEGDNYGYFWEHVTHYTVEQIKQ